MERELYSKLIAWKNSKNRKPLVVNGARQVGKSYLITEFIRNEFEDHLILNCDKDARIAGIFENGYRTDKIISDIEVIFGKKIIPEKTAIFIDEIGEAPRALAALKYFCEDAPEYPIIVAGSLLGLAIHQGVSFPVGKVDEMTLHPMTFPEYVLNRLGRGAYDMLNNAQLSELSSLKTTYMEVLREYFFTGGMPEIVNGFINGEAPQALRDMQKRILADYSLDISKHADSSILGRIHQVWSSIPQQLAKRNKKFIYGNIQKGARAKDFELAIEWLLDAGLVHKISRVRKAGIPLKFYEDFSANKLFLLDHGLIGAMTDTPISSIMVNNNVFEEYIGTFTEQYVLEQLICYSKTEVFYYDSESTKLEIDFLIQSEDKLRPIEVKAAENLRSKSLRQFYLDHPDSLPVRISMSDYRKEDWMENIPLYAANRVQKY